MKKLSYNLFVESLATNSGFKSVVYSVRMVKKWLLIPRMRGMDVRCI